MATADVKGLKEARAAFKALEPAARERFGEATRVTVSEIARIASQKAPRRLGHLRAAIGFSFSRKTGRGRAGIASKRIVIAGAGGSALTKHGAKVVNPAKYAKFAEFGTRRHSAQPFMIPAATSQEQPYLSRCQQAGKAIEKDVAAIGARTL